MTQVLTAKLHKGQRIEVPVHYNAWMQGARFGTVTGYRQSQAGRSAFYYVRLDNPRYRFALKLWEPDVPYCKILVSSEDISAMYEGRDDASDDS